MPVGDIVYGAGAAGTAIYKYGLAVANWVGTYGPAAVDTVSNGWSWLKNKASNIFKAKDSSKNEQHGDGGRALEKANKQIKELEKKLDDAIGKKEKDKIRQKIINIKDTAKKKARGENHSQGNKR